VIPIRLALIAAALLAVVASRPALLAAQAPIAEGDPHTHAGMSHASEVPVPAEGSGDYLTVNIDVTDDEIRPASAFVPAGRPVRLVLRNRGVGEHHYRVIGLVPDDLYWISPADTEPSVGMSDDEHDHHRRQLLRERAPSPAGIQPSGHEVHAWARGQRGTDAVFFTASQTGTFTVECNLHPEQRATLTVFAGAATPTPTASVSAASPGQPRMLARLLTRDLGSVSYADAPDVRVEATYATTEYVVQALGGSSAAADLQPDRHIAFLVTEQTHTANLPGNAAPPEVAVNGRRVPLVDSRPMTGSVHHRATLYRFARDDEFGSGHQVMTLRLATGQEATWHLPIVIPPVAAASVGPVGLGEQWGLILALLGGMVAAMWPCLFQLTVYFIPALAGVAMQESAGTASGRRRQVLVAAFYFILGFTLVYTATGALIGFATQRMGGTEEFEAWQRYFGMAAGVVVIGLALRVAAKVRAPLVCKMPVLSRMAHSGRPATRLEMMLAGLAFATGCMTCFGSALVVGMVVYVGLAQSPLYGALVLFLFSLGMGIPLVIAAVAMARALPLLMKLESAVPWMGLVSAVLMASFGVLLLSGNYMVVSEWTFRIVNGTTSLATPTVPALVATAAGVGCLAWLIWKFRTVLPSSARRA
jgi:cytochrome c-type biogenesis protein